MKTNFRGLNALLVVEIARKKPMKAKGIAKIVCANNTNDKYFFIEPVIE
ncbi:hypothetical protein ADIARSV_0562 [Arcticibacter svalbardensis MN12-7]|uniref:Uncharacterized protein n=1 Tax=Arcticibacter svalbardensis MN12-7 TaxID=1150600 RepID=R9GWV8_9SPHI|nr:hypothetical protein ADIARSV_0562 [Arcticibacter svalbardensis MN12-7]